MKKIIALIAFVVPSMAFAQALTPITNVNNLSSRILGIGSTFTYILVAFAVIFIVYNVVMYVIKPSASDDKKAAGLNVLWGILGLFIIVSIWGIVNILTNTFSTTTGIQPIPNVGNNPQTGGIPANQVPIVQ